MTLAIVLTVRASGKFQLEANVYALDHPPAPDCTRRTQQLAAVFADTEVRAEFVTQRQIRAVAEAYTNSYDETEELLPAS